MRSRKIGTQFKRAAIKLSRSATRIVILSLLTRVFSLLKGKLRFVRSAREANFNQAPFGWKKWKRSLFESVCANAQGVATRRDFFERELAIAVRHAALHIVKPDGRVWFSVNGD